MTKEDEKKCSTTERLGGSSREAASRWEGGATTRGKLFILVVVLVIFRVGRVPMKMSTRDGKLPAEAPEPAACRWGVDH